MKNSKPLFPVLSLLTLAVGMAISCPSYGIFDPKNEFTVDAGKFPFSQIVRLKIDFKDGHHGFCSGAIISPKLVLTAVHCVFDSSDSIQQVTEMRTGLISQKPIAGNAYSLGSGGYRVVGDVAFIYFSDANFAEPFLDIDFTSEVHSETGIQALATGYGAHIDPVKISEVDGNLRAHECRVELSVNSIGSKSSCGLRPGDSGAPLIIGNSIVGVASTEDGMFSSESWARIEISKAFDTKKYADKIVSNLDRLGNQLKEVGYERNVQCKCDLKTYEVKTRWFSSEQYLNETGSKVETLSLTRIGASESLCKIIEYKQDWNSLSSRENCIPVNL
ncbi:MAG: trypsin-like serine protease [Bdellovibrionia bacterium]